MAGFAGPTVRTAHVDTWAQAGELSGPASVATARPGLPAGVATARPGLPAGVDREAREAQQDAILVPGATRAVGAGTRRRPEEPDPWRTCFERDRDRVLHATAFRRLAGKTQVFVFPEDHQRTRLTHALEVAQVATSVAQACGLNVALTEAIALGHDCGHGPGGHASEEAFDPFLAGGFDHAPWGADVSLAALNLCAETADGIRNHSWSRPAPSTPEGEVVSWADRIAYVCHDWEDAVRAGVVAPDMLPHSVRALGGDRRSSQLGAFIDALVSTVLHTGRIGMDDAGAEALAAFRTANYEHIYLRPASVEQGQAVVAVLRALVEHFADRPDTIPAAREAGGLRPGGDEAVRAAVTYVAGMTDRFAFRRAVSELGWDPAELPRGLGS
ncbi:MAG: HD domain-containing protein [Acidimicrobiales bacterium]